MLEICKEHIITNVPINEIFCDNGFNCRGEFMPIDVTDLAQSIKKQGLIQAGSCQPWTQKEGKSYRLVTGHRRYKACQILGWEFFPCRILTGITEIEAEVINLDENLNRANLNILQEAHAVGRIRDRGMNISQISKLLKRYTEWVNVRLMLLDLPEDIQNEAAAGFITQRQIKDLCDVDPEYLYEAFRSIKDAKLRGESKKVNTKIKIPKEIDPKVPRKLKTFPEVFALQDHITERIGPCLATRCLALVAGLISYEEFDVDLEEEYQLLQESYVTVGDE